MRPRFLKKTPVETYQVGNKELYVYRADLVPQPPLAPYLKMIELYPFLKLIASRGFKTFGYYAIPESEWVVSVPSLAESVGMKAVIGISKTKVMPDYTKEIEDSLFLLSPNIYSVNFARTRKHVEGLKGYMAPMGLACQEVVDGMTEFLSGSPLPKSDSYVVPTGSGVALCGILNHLKGKGKIVGVCTRPVNSVAKVVSKYSRFDNYSLCHRQTGKSREDLPFPMHPFWDQNAFLWLQENLDSLKGSVTFVNLGSGATR